jgi:hypothetical protein
MSGESRGPYQLAPPRSYPYQSNQDPRTIATQHGGTHHVYPYSPAQTYGDRSPYNPSTGSSAQSGRRDDEAATRNHGPSYSPNIRTGYPADQFGEEVPEFEYPSESQIWAELRRLSARIASLEEAVTRYNQAIDHINELLDAIKKRLDALEAAHAKKASEFPKASTNQHPKVSRLQLYLPHTQRTN